jgi:hypothetical protein
MDRRRYESDTALAGVLLSTDEEDNQLLACETLPLSREAPLPWLRGADERIVTLHALVAGPLVATTLLGIVVGEPIENAAVREAKPGATVTTPAPVTVELAAEILQPRELSETQTLPAAEVLLSLVHPLTAENVPNIPELRTVMLTAPVVALFMASNLTTPG